MLSASFAQTAQAQTATSAGHSTVTRLANGLTVLVLPDQRFPLVSLRLYVHAGSAYERPEEAGISHMLEHMVFKGTQKRPKGQVARDVEGTGGYLNAATSFDYTVYLTDMTKEHWKMGLDVLKDMAFHPSLVPAELESEKDVVVAELKRGEDNPGQRLFRMSQGLALEGTPYAVPIIGSETTIRSFTSEMIRDYIERLYQPGSMLLVVVGDVDAKEVLAEASAQFGDLTNSHPVAAFHAAEEPALSGFRVSVEQGPWNKVYLSLALPAPGFDDVRAARLDVLAQVLGGDATSRLYRTFKYEKRLVDSISAANYSFERLGMLYIRATLDADKLVPFWQSLCKELTALGKSDFSKAELDRAKLNIEDDLFRSKETLSGYASKVGHFALFGSGGQDEKNYLRTVMATDSQMLKELALAYLRPDAMSLAALLPQGTSLDLLPKGSKAESWDAWFADALAAQWKSPERSLQAQSAKAASSTPEIIDLGKGRTVVLQADTTLPYAAVNLIFTGGDMLLDEKDQGLATFTASLLSKGTKKLSATKVEDYLSDRAAAFGAASGRQTFSLNMNAPSRFLDDMFALLHDTLITPAMKDEEAARVRENQIAAIVTREDQPTSLAFRRMFPFLFSGHSYGYLGLGEKDRVAAFKAKDARVFWAKQTLRPWVLSVCGTFDREGVLRAAEKLPVPGTEADTLAEPVWNQAKELDLHLAGRNQAHYFMVFPTVGYGHEDEAGLDVLQNILAGQSGLLFRDMRDKQGLGYTVTAFPWKSEKTGALIFYIGTEPDKLEQAEAGFAKVIAFLHKEILPEEELQRGKNQINGDYYREHQSLASRSAEAGVLTILQRPLDAARALVDKAQAVTAEEVRALAVKYIEPDKAYVIKVLP